MKNLCGMNSVRGMNSPGAAPHERRGQPGRRALHEWGELHELHEWGELHEWHERCGDRERSGVDVMSGVGPW